ncbi:MAG: hypothetical protein EBR40_11785 [Proteobacteria bacterium]|nr:hypothetical protein [Pseudomonadota bacterium]
MNYLILLGIMSLFIFGQKTRTNWVSGIKSTLTKMMTPGADRRLFSGFTASPIGWIRNAVSWVRAFNWTGVAAGINGLGGVGGGTLITRKHVLFAQHVPYPERPFDIFFTNKDSRTFSYKVTAIQQVAGTDIAIGTLDRDADPSLNVYRVLPDNWLQYIANKTETLTTFGITFKETKMTLPILYVDSEKKVSTADLTEVRMNKATVTPPSFEPARAWTEALVVGDSGNPIFVMLGSELVLLGAWYAGTDAGVVGTFPWLIDYKAQIESITGTKLQIADLSGLDRIA